MREIYGAIAGRLRSGLPCAVATLVAARQAAPAAIGTSMLVDADGSFTGNIGAGCHEAELVESAAATLRDGSPRTIDFDVTDDLLDGSACGAVLTVAIWLPDPGFAAIADRIVAGEEPVEFSCGSHAIRIERKRSLVVVGATDLAAHLTRAANASDFSVTIIDPRPAFATTKRHPDARRVLVAWPDEVLPSLLGDADAIVVVGHDAKIDLPALRCALQSDIAYIGLLGSRRSQSARGQSLQELGYTARALARIHGPAGLDVGAISNAQVACSILAEILSVLNDRSAAPLRSVPGPIHSSPERRLSEGRV
ncbi:MAG: XdhC family protein [Candidatus Cybelea sp.]